MFVLSLGTEPYLAISTLEAIRGLPMTLHMLCKSQLFYSSNRSLEDPRICNAVNECQYQPHTS